MTTNQIPILLRLVSASVCVARRAGLIVKNVINKGNLGIVMKVNKLNSQYLLDTLSIYDLYI